MVPRIAKRGHSFNGAGQYYLHDKQAQTDERVSWTYTHNIPTQDPEKAMKWMAYTASNANSLKRQAGVVTTGRKSKAGVVYSFSLAWHPEQKPDQEVMLEAALHTLGLLKLNDHEAVMVAHNDTEHPHVHVICNLVNPENGKVAVQSYDRLTMSVWAEEYERNEGEIRCEERVINNAKRRNELSLTQKFKMVKHRDKKLDRADEIQKLYDRSDSASAFKGALEQAGYTLAQGDRRGHVLVDSSGEIFALSRQLKGQRAKDIRKYFKDIGELPKARELSDERKHFDRDQYEADRQKKIVDAAIEEDRKKAAQEKLQPTKSFNKKSKPEPHQEKPPLSKSSKQELSQKLEKQPTKKPPTPKKTKDIKVSEKFLKHLDALRAWEQERDRKKHELEEIQGGQYNRNDLLNQIEELENRLNPKDEKMLDKLTGKNAKWAEQLEDLRKNLANIDQRIQEQDKAFEAEMNKTKPVDLEAEKRKRIEEIQRKLKRQGPSNNLDKGPDLGR